jgi:hypothetical protein
MNIQTLKDRFRIRLPGLGRAARADAPEPFSAELAAPAVQVVAIEKHAYAFGLDWRFFTDRKDLGQTLRAAKRDGFNHQVVTQTEDLVGLARLEKGAVKGRLHCASLQLVQSVSQGGMELFVFQLDQELYALVALNDSRPIVDFEKIGSRSDILSLAGEFQLAQVGHTIRQAGNTGALEHEEPIKLSEAFGRLDETTRIKKIPDYKLLLIGLAVALGLGLAVNFVHSYLNAEKIKQRQAREARERDPNFVYEKAIGASMQDIGLPARVQLERWRTTLRPIPVSRQGWTLTSIVCLPQECKLAWKRSYGSFIDFYAASQANEMGHVENQDAGNPANSRIETTLKVSAMPEGRPGLDRQALTGLTDIQRPLASQLQDLSLLSASKVSMKVAELYPATGGLNVAQIDKPVVRGEWTFTHDLWSLDEVNFTQASLVLESITLSPDEKSGQWTYSLKGHYYAKGKSF